VENALFYLSGAAAVVFALGVILSRSPVASVLCLLGCFFGLATVYLLMGFQVLAAAQILVYAGAIMVLFLFVIMLLNLGHLGPLPRLDRAVFRRRNSVAAVLVAAGLLSAAVLSALGARGAGVEAAALPEHGLDPPELLARSLFGRYALPFEAASLLLLATAVAVVVLAKRERGGREERDA